MQKDFLEAERRGLFPSILALENYMNIHKDFSQTSDIVEVMVTVKNALLKRT